MSIKKIVNVEARNVVFQFDEKTSIVATLDGLSEDMITRLALHGLSQKMGDAYASNNGPQDAKGKASEVYDGLRAGQWTTGKTGGGGDLVEALMQETGKTREDCAAKIAGMTEDERKGLRKNVKIAARLLAIKAARTQQRADAMKTEDGDTDELAALFA